MKPIRSIAFVTNAGKPGAVGLAEELVGVARAKGVRLRQTTRFPLPRGYLRGCDACCVIGGDGTLLDVAREAAEQKVPIIGINRGSLGFLTTFSPDEARAEFEGLLKGSFRVDNRTMLSCRVGRGAPNLALNDVLIKDELNTNLVHLEVFADSELVTDYVCDGLIFSTATGSTAYNLSAGGPIIHPAARVIAMTPICPHTLTNRSIIFRDSVRLSVHNRTVGTRVLVGIDGHRELKATAHEPIEISIAGVRLALAQRRGYSHFAVVRTKLKWSGGASERDSAQ
ncbi:MAG TPA: NAD(+)/NADH kinase [Opitutaceae bacterium]|nr:NAD(+)/NADH kinase [Opitutaceae bacterium]